MVLIEAAFTIDAVEGAYLAVGRQQVDAEGNAQATAVNRAEDGRRIDNCTHNGCKGTPFFETNEQKKQKNICSCVLMSKKKCNFAPEFEFLRT